MNPNILMQGPLLQPQWRLRRVVQLVGHRPEPLRPGRYDDHYVRAYRRILLDLAEAGDDAEQQAQVFREYPAVCHAHRLHYSADLERRQILEARLLTSETFAEIAIRMATEPSVIAYYERLFFSVRDRLQHSDWIRLAAIGPRSGSHDARRGTLTEDQRGYLYRLFGYFGGPLVLDTLISGMVATEIPRREEDVRCWFTDALGQLVRTTGAAAAATLEMNEKDMLQSIKLSVRMQTAAAKRRGDAPFVYDDSYAEAVLAAIEPYPAPAQLGTVAKEN